MISIGISLYEVRHILIDTVSFAAILFYDVFAQINLLQENLKSVKTSLVSLTGSMVESLDSIDLLVVSGKESQMVDKMVSFLGVNLP